MKSFKALAFILTIVGIAVVVLVLTQFLPGVPANDDTGTLTLPAPDPTQQNPLIFETSTPQKELAWSQPLTLIDEQGAVSVEVTPTNLINPIELLYFEISLNTHSVDLSMNLAEMAVLMTDNGLEIVGNLWDAPLGGHHVTGVLSFLISENEISLLVQAQELTLIIHGLDAPDRIFVWNK